MRISDIGNWATCEAMALESPPRTAGRTNVAAHVGTLAHAKLAGITPALPGSFGIRYAHTINVTTLTYSQTPLQNTLLTLCKNARLDSHRPRGRIEA